VGAPEVMRNYVMPHQIELMQRASRVFVQTGLEGRALAQFNVPSAAISRLGMGINLADAAGADGARFRTRHAIPPNAPIVSFMGSITRDKGAVSLLHAMQRLWSAGLDAYLVLAGEAPGPGGFDRALARIPISMHSRVLRVGVLRGTDKHDMLAASGIFALPSRVDSFGIVYLEAWAHGVPVIGADAGGVPDVIAHEKDGFVLPFDDAEALAAHIQLLIEQPDLARSLGAAGRIKVATGFTWEAIYAKLADTYRELMQNRILTPS
jgi:glycosyltransferase involved in cell wall biosynthesis